MTGAVAHTREKSHGKITHHHSRSCAYVSCGGGVLWRFRVGAFIKTVECDGRCRWQKPAALVCSESPFLVLSQISVPPWIQTALAGSPITYRHYGHAGMIRISHAGHLPCSTAGFLLLQVQHPMIRTHVACMHVRMPVTAIRHSRGTERRS